MPDLEEGAPKHLRRIAAHEAEIPLHLTPSPVHGTFALHMPQTVIILPEVARQHNLAEQELTLLRIRCREQVTVIHTIDPLQHPHYCTGKPLHTQRPQHTHGVLTLLRSKSLVQHEIVVEQLAQPYPLGKQMAIDMYEDEHAVERIVRNRKFLVMQ